MKYILILLLSIPTLAKDINECILNDQGVCKVETEKIEKRVVKEKIPKTFKNSKIKRRLKDGSYQEFDGNKYKIVPRKQSKFKVVKKTKKIKPVIIREKLIPGKYKNSISLMYGRTPTKLVVDKNVNTYEARTKAQDDVLLMYQRDFGGESKYRASFGLSVKGNSYIGIGVNF